MTADIRTRSVFRRSWPLLVLPFITAVAAIIVLVLTLRISYRITDVYASLDESASTIKLELAMAHLWLEEIIADDPEESIATVWRHLDHAQAQATHLHEYTAGSAASGTALRDQALQQHIVEMLRQLDEFRDLAQARYSGDSPAGSEADMLFDSAFGRAMAHADEIEFSLHAIRDRDYRTSRTYQFLAIAITVLLAVTTMLVLVRSNLQKRKAYEKLARSEEQFRAIVVNSQPIIFVLDSDGVFKLSEGQGLKVLGLEPGQVVGMSAIDLYAEFSEIVAGIEEARAGRTARRTVQIGDLYFDAFFAPLQSAHGQLNGVLGMAVDVTRQYVLADRLVQSKKLEAVGMLAGGVAHDFNNILQAILGYAQLMIEDGNDDGTSQNLQQIIHAAERAAGLTRQLLAYSRRQVLEPRDVDLNEVTRQFQGMISRLIGDDISVRFIPGEDLGTVHADPGQIEQVLMNLAANARDAMPEGGQMTILTENIELGEDYSEAHLWAHPGRYVLMSVTDNGLGMDAEAMEHAFEPFFTTKEVGKGTGLGLATVYGIVKQHDGLVHIYSEPERGTEVKIYLPVVARPAEVLEQRAPGPVQGGIETVLVAEDDASLLQLITQLLQGHGYSVVPVCDGQQAVEAFRDGGRKIDLVLLDVVMPVLGGRRAYDRIRELDEQVPMLFTSGYNVNAIHTEFILHEGLQLIRKPFGTDELLRTVRDLLDRAAV